MTKELTMAGLKGKITKLQRTLDETQKSLEQVKSRRNWLESQIEQKDRTISRYDHDCSVLRTEVQSLKNNLNEADAVIKFITKKSIKVCGEFIERFLLLRGQIRSLKDIISFSIKNIETELSGGSYDPQRGGRTFGIQECKNELSEIEALDNLGWRQFIDRGLLDENVDEGLPLHHVLRPEHIDY